MKLFGLDVHREFTQVAMLEQRRLTHLGRIPTTPEALRAFAQTLGPDDQVALEATGNTYVHIPGILVTSRSSAPATEAIRDGLETTGGIYTVAEGAHDHPRYQSTKSDIVLMP